ncbi:MAG: hypothetical protein VR72_11980 [Clostridiaceae bacterium BRH_c20a]|nr:MAG: hypothetical protein VR72_11980 [Clostridiaceae bacterium BRH_c20a]
MGTLKELFSSLILGDTLDDNKTDYYSLLSKVNHQRNETNKLIHETSEHIKKLKKQKPINLSNEFDDYQINHQIIRLQSRIEELTQQISELNKIEQKINTALLEDKIQRTTIKHYQIELELNQFKR